MKLYGRGAAIIVAVVLGLLLIGTASAYTVPDEYKGQATNDVELFALAQGNEGYPWADYIIRDMGYKYNVRNYAQFKIRMEYQAKFPKIVRNNMVNTQTGLIPD